MRKGAIEAEMLIMLADIFFLLLIAAVLASEINEVNKDTAFEKAYVAADLAALLTTIQSFAGDIIVEYPLPLLLTIELRNNEIIVSDEGRAVSRVFSKILPVVPAKLSATKLTISKKNGEVSIS